MFNNSSGMDVDQVRRIAAQLHLESENIGQLISRVASQITVARQVWKGTDSDHFVEEWQAKQSQLHDIQVRIHRLSMAATSQANQQSEASQAW